MSSDGDDIKRLPPSKGKSKPKRGGDSEKPEITASYDGEAWILRYGELSTTHLGPFRTSDLVEAAAALSGLGSDEIEAWMEHPDPDDENWTVQPKHVLAVVQGLRHSLEEATPPSAPVHDKGFSTQVSKLAASLIGERVNLNAQIVSEKGQKALPEGLVVRCTRCMGDVEVDLSDPDHSSLLEAVIFMDKAALKRRAEAAFFERVGRQCEKKKDHRVVVEEEGNMDYAVLGARDLLEEIEKFDKQVYQARTIHLIGVRPPPSKKVHFLGRVIVDPSTRDIYILADSAEPLESQIAGFEVTDEDRAEWPRWFNGELDITAQIAPDMVGRENVQQAYLLFLHSVAVIPDVHGRLIKGCLRVLGIGDTKTYKSEGARDLTIDHLNLGGYITAESSSRTGITYAIDTEEKAIIWGELVLNDLGLCVIDGLHAMSGEEMKQLREALEVQRVIVRRYVSGDAKARTRVLGLLNPEKPMNQYTHSCMAVKDSSAFYDPPDITRWDVFLTFGDKDVSSKEIAMRNPVLRPIPEEAFKRHVYWVWSRRPEHIEYTEDAVHLIKESSVELIEKYALSSLPIVHRGARDVICRVSVAMAALHHSTDEAHNLVVVDEAHVEKALQFYKDMLDRLKLAEYKEKVEGKLKIEPSELVEIVADLGTTEFDILRAIEIQTKSSTTLALELDFSERTIKEHYKPLRRHGLIETRPGVGVQLSPRGVQFLNALTPELSEIVKKSFTKSKGQQKMVKRNFTISLSPSVGGDKNIFSGAGEEGRAAIQTLLNSEGGETTILRLQLHLEEQGYDLDSLNDGLSRLETLGCITVMGDTISLGPEWSRGPEDERPPSKSGTGETPGTLLEALIRAEAVGVRLVEENGGEPITEADYCRALVRELGLKNQKIKSIVGILLRDGRAFRPRPDALGFVGRVVGAKASLIGGTGVTTGAEEADVDQEKLRRVSDALRMNGPTQADALAEGLGLPVEETERMLKAIERDGHARQLPSGRWEWLP